MGPFRAENRIPDPQFRTALMRAGRGRLDAVMVFNVRDEIRQPPLSDPRHA